MKTIIVSYWYSDLSKETGMKRNSEFPYSKAKRDEIINSILDKKLQIMTYEQNDSLIIWVDNEGGRFRQR